VYEWLVPGMVRRTRALAERHGVDLPVLTCEWEELGRQGWHESFDAVFCVGNSLTHAAGKARAGAPHSKRWRACFASAGCSC
jgi:hypothetical protein